jgi:hypothetical protein
MPGMVALTAKQVEAELTDPAMLAQMEAATGYGKTTLQKAARVLAGRGWIVLVRKGKNRLTRAERDELLKAGSAARQRRNVWACTVPPHLRGRPPVKDTECVASQTGAADLSTAAVDKDQALPAAANRSCALPATQGVGGVRPVSLRKIFKADQTSSTDPTGRAAGRERTARRRYRADCRTVALARELKSRIYWLQSTPFQRIMPSLDRFAKAGWNAADVQRELDALLALRRWEVPTSRVTVTRGGRVHEYPLHCPWGYLAMLLRGIEPADLVARRDHEKAIRRAQLEYEQILRSGPECPHGQPGGAIPSPVKGVLACPFCRRGTGAPVQ